MMPPAPPPAAPAPPSEDQPTIPLSADALAQWKEDIQKAEAVRKTYEPWMETVLRDYVPSAKDNPDTYASLVHTLRAFILVERKKADYFYQRPEVSQVPSPLMDGPIPGVQGPPNAQGQPGTVPMTAAVQANEDIVNELLGPSGIDAKKLAHEVLFDVLATAGQGWTALGYESVTIDQTTTDPLTGLERTTPVPVYERCYWDYIPPKQTLKPADFRSTDWEKAPWLGYKFTLPVTAATRKKFHLPDGFTGSPDDTSQHFDYGAGTTTQAATRKVFTGTCVWYKSAQYREDVVHPEHFTLLVLVDGMPEPAIHQDSPHQAFDARGQLTSDSLIGNPIHPFSIRSLTDSAYPPSDAMVIKPLENELNRFRTQMVESRDAMILRWMYNTGVLPPDALGKIVRSPIGGMIGVPPEAFVGEGSIKELPHGSFPRESFTSNDYVDSDIARAGGVDASGAGVQGVTQTATAEQRQQANTNARFDFERGVFLDRYLAGVTKYAQLVMRWLPLERATQIVGPQRAAWWEAWRKAIPAPVAFTALPDSALRTDQATDRAQAKELYSFLAQDPYIAQGRAKLLEKLLRKYHIDPMGIVAPPPPSKPEPPKLSMTFKAEDLVAPQGPIVLEILAQQGITVKPETVTTAMALQQQSVELAAQADATKAAAKAAPNTTHGGMLAPQESLSKHSSDISGNMQGTGAPAPLGVPGGHLQ